MIQYIYFFELQEMLKKITENSFIIGVSDKSPSLIKGD